MNTKAISILSSVPFLPAAAYATMGIASLVCCSYIVWIGSYFYSSSGGQTFNLLAADEVLTQLGTIRDGRLSEISGIAMSMHDDQQFWVHNDSGHPPELFLIGTDGAVHARVKLKGAVNRDWEDICTFKIDNTAYICVGDVGDNGGNHKEYRLYFIKEPRVNRTGLETPASEKSLVISDFQTVVFNYEDGPKNCEAFAWDAASNSILLAEKGFDRKRKNNLGIYRLNLGRGFAEQDKLVAKRIATCKLKNSTAMSISGDGKKLVLSSYAMAAVWNRESSNDWAQTLNSNKPAIMPLPMQRQGEAITLNQTGSLAFTTSELTNQPLWQIDVDSVVKKTRANSESKSESK